MVLHHTPIPPMSTIRAVIYQSNINMGPTIYLDRLRSNERKFQRHDPLLSIHAGQLIAPVRFANMTCSRVEAPIGRSSTRLAISQRIDDEARPRISSHQW